MVLKKEDRSVVLATTTAAAAAATAAQVASEAVQVAKEVALRAADTAREVAILAQRTSEAVLLFGKDLIAIKEDVAEIKGKLENKYVTTDVFTPIKNVVYGLVGVILLSVVGALVALVIVK